MDPGAEHGGKGRRLVWVGSVGGDCQFTEFGMGRGNEVGWEGEA